MNPLIYISTALLAFGTGLGLGKRANRSDTDEYDGYTDGTLFPKEQRQYTRDLKRWGTKEGVIDVARDLPKTTEKCFCVPVGSSNPKNNKFQKKAYLSDLKRWGTKEGVIDVASSSGDRITTCNSKSSNKTSSYLSDLRKWGTKEQVIDVAQTTAPNCIPIGFKTVVPRKNSTTYKASYQKDIRRWGTKQGVIDVANDLAAKQKEKEIEKAIIQQGSRITEEFHPDGFHFKKENRLIEKDFYQNIREQFKIEQLVITNPCNVAQHISLFHPDRKLADPVTDISEVTTVPIDIDIPDGLIANPVNGLLYGIHQLTNVLVVVETTGEAIAVVDLEPNFYPGLHSPSGLAVISGSLHAKYGHVYVMGSVANIVSVIDTNHQVIDTIPVGVRPVAIAYNPVNDFIYVCNLVSATLSCIDPESNQVIATLPTGNSPKCVTVHPDSGDILVGSSLDNSVWVYSATHQLKSKIGNIGEGVADIAYHPGEQNFYVTAIESEQVYPIGDGDYDVKPPIKVQPIPLGVDYNPQSDALYVQHDSSVSYCSKINSDHTVSEAFDISGIASDLAMSADGSLFFGITEDNELQTMSVQDTDCSVSINSKYAEILRNFTYNPVLIRHAKFVFSTPDRFPVLNIHRTSITGKRTTSALSFENYRRPQNGLNVAEITGLEGEWIDNQHYWGFKMPPKQTITILIYYQQFNMYQLHRGFPPDTPTQKAIERTIPIPNL